MGLYTWIKKSFQNEYKTGSLEYKQRLQDWRKEGVITYVGKPTNIARARSLGYKAKEGFFVVRVKTKKGRRARSAPVGGRKPSKNFKYISPGKSYQAQAEEKAARKYSTREVLNSYWVGEDGQQKYFEVIMYDSTLNTIPKELRNKKGRAFRGLTSIGKKHRSMRHRGKGMNRPVR
ncbi:MAG: 50S ribosomal protein L15e [Candidatus Micrarchaeia archaeon]|jgi:large subunit ribosomal protein L15e